MGQTLTNGVYLPDEGERNCYTGLAENWRALDYLIGGYNVHIADAVIHVSQADRDKWDAVDNKADTTALTAHTGNTTIHVTAADKEAWNGKANDADVVHKAGAETIAGPKTFNSNTSIYNSDNSAVTPNLYLRSSKIEIAAQGNTSGDQNLAYADKNNTVYAYVKGAIQSNGSAVKIRALCKDNSDNSIINEIQILANTNGRKIIFPSNTNETELGTSSYKWKDVNTVLINGLTPSSWSLPGVTSIDISAYVTDLSGGSNQYRAPDNGFVAIDISNTNRFVLFNNDLGFGDRLTASNARRAAILQVRKNDSVIIQSSGGTLNYAKFYPFQGNI